MRKMLKKLEDAYEYPVDVEFTVNFSDSDLKINLVQCRPLQTMGEAKRMDIPADTRKSASFFRQRGSSWGATLSSRSRVSLRWIPKAIRGLPLSEKYDIARLIGKLNRLIKDREEIPDAAHRAGQVGHVDTHRSVCRSAFPRSTTLRPWRRSRTPGGQPHAGAFLRHAIFSRTWSKPTSSTWPCFLAGRTLSSTGAGRHARTDYRFSYRRAGCTRTW